MHKWEKIRFLKNVSSSWFSLAINVAIGVLLSPFILHRLGDAAFGVWVLIFSITGYYGIFDVGLRSAVVRYVSKFAATDGKEELTRLINTNLFLYLCTATGSMLLSIVLAMYFDHIFRIAPELRSAARLLVLITGASVSLGFPLSLMDGILEGLQQYYILSFSNIVASLLRALLIVIAMQRGGGLITIALITVVVATAASVYRAFVAMRLCPVPFGFRYVRRQTFHTTARYSSVSFMLLIATRLKFKSDEIVLGTMMSAAAITHFNIGARIVDYAGMVVTNLAQMFIPMSSESEAIGDRVRLRKIFLAGNRFCALVIFPMCVTLIILGKSVIEVWVGKKYIATSYPVLVILILPCTLLWGQAASTRLLLGIGKHRTWAVVTLIEGILNLILSFILVRPYGIIGDAFGTAIPMIGSMVLFMPRHICRELDIRLGIYLRESYLLPLLLCVPLALALWLMQQFWFVPHRYLQLGVQLLLGGAIYAVGLGWAFLTNRATQVRGVSRSSQKHPGDVSLVTAPEMESSQQDA